MDASFSIDSLPAGNIVHRLERHDATSLPVLSERYRLELLEEAKTAVFRPARESIGDGDRVVYQRMEVCDKFPDGSGFVALRDRFQALWDKSFSNLPDCPFESPVVFNDLMLQRYAPGEVGITPHRDRTGYRNIICLFVLAGRGRFAVCEDRSGTNAREISNAPGEVILTRAPGFLNSSARPFHFVRDIQTTRYVFGLRQERR